MKAEIFEFSIWLTEIDSKTLQQTIQQYVTQAGFNVVNFVEHEFSPQGYTAIWLLSESHLAIHTFPEEGKTYLQLSSCEKLKKEAFAELAQNSTLV